MDSFERMTAIREYPLDFSDIRNTEPYQPPDITMVKPKQSDSNLHSILTSAERKASNCSRKTSSERKVSIMAGDPNKDSKVHETERNGRVSTHQAEGPSRRKSNLHNALAAEIDGSWDRQHHIEGRFKKYSTTSTIYSKKTQQSEHVERSWWYACCQKCHQEDVGIPSWEPPNWQKVCPRPFCPSFRKVARLVTLCTIGLLFWLTLWLVMGIPAGPGGQLFTLAILTLAAHLGGWALQKTTTLPALIGMLIMGVIMKNVGFVHFDKDYQLVVSYIRKIALTILLIRAGMDLDPHALRKHFLTVIKLSLLPWTFEFVLCAVMVFYFIDLPWDWAFLLGSIVAAVSPAVIVPCLMRLRRKGYGVSKGIPTLVLAVSGIDDAASVAVFGILISVIFPSNSLTMTIVSGPLSVVIGIAFGLILGYFVKYVPERNDAFLVPLRVLFLLFGGIVSMLGFEEIGWGGAGPLAVITFAFIACKNWSDLGWEHEDNPAVTAFEIFWMFFEPMLFSVTGAQIDIPALPGDLVLIGSGILGACAITRAILTSVCAVRSNLNFKEKVFVGLAWMAKATVQAALGPVPLDRVHEMARHNETGYDAETMARFVNYAEVVVTICILSIVITAPIGAIVITITGPRLLSRTTKPPILEGWRRSNRPSLRDISIIDEEEVAERDVENSRPVSPIPLSKEVRDVVNGAAKEVKECLPIIVQPTGNNS
ncbi:sodium/hydrogen exchanger 9B1-like isoform X2 [Hyposmocoma kahamanoa]|uniref:sodium/hydrogen exchanger 9B1-like isoform X2 n=1 Tax=Hyposmocoma kahamanoa TaxID=1477025 RepID=UPI000E6D8BAB|nr:sodium/hydrogen exchanger 9B1-like isoform X2 [Hyposmocoma kahamanoa]